MRTGALDGALALWLLAAMPALAAGSASVGDAGTGGDEAAGLDLRSGWRLLVFPDDEDYPVYIADPHAPAAALQLESFSDTAIEEAGESRFYLKLGGRFGLLRWVSPAPRGRTWQINLDAGLDAQFDKENGLDNTGWDGNYGLSLVAARRGGGLAWKLGIFHTSAHLGDEWIERTGLERINYTREETALGVSWRGGDGWRLYGEAGWAHEMRNRELMEPGRVQAGVERRLPGRFWKGVGGWYVALDLSAWEERDWRLDAAFQAGLLIVSGGQEWRLGVQYQDGRVPLGEFFRLTEASLAVGLWSEL